uniref:Receptor-type tyrosine-protein phosphatase-like N n=1 Tax=Eptatretus burgeri TaxID=7764 RepID=A0A8C4X0R7_EPTBU
MEDHVRNRHRLQREWEALCMYQAEPCSCTIAQNLQNVFKNRTPVIVPYDHARVVLNSDVNASASDYINASLITDHDPRTPAYIAAQSPMAHTISDFWQMVWENRCVVLVMLCPSGDEGKDCCPRYWPTEGSAIYHKYEVHLVSEHVCCEEYVVRSLYLKHMLTGETRTVTQFHFLRWAPKDVPSAPYTLLEFRRKVNKCFRGRSCPIIVHCSDGSGHSGTYILLDMVLNRVAKGTKEIDIAATLEFIRDQRPKMVETKEQFAFCLTAVAEEVNSILKSLPK